MFTIPNILTILRLLLCPFVFYFIVSNQPSIALGLFLLGLLTDISDGYLARHYRWTTRFGQILDPIADKILMASVVYAILIQHQLWLWLAGALVMTIALAVGYPSIIRKNIPVLPMGRVAIVGASFLLILMIRGTVNAGILSLFAFLVVGPALYYLWICLARRGQTAS